MNGFKINTTALTLMLALILSGCGGTARRAVYVISTNHPHLCCRTIRYSTTDFPDAESAGNGEPGVSLRLRTDTLRGACSRDAGVDVVIANREDHDVYIPVSRELEGASITMYPWRFLFVNDKPMRLARQIQYGDILERNDARLQFTRLPSGKQVRLHGVIPKLWLCAQPSPIYEGYLAQELDPLVYAGQARAVRDASSGRREPLQTNIQLRYDVVYTTLDYYMGLPRKSISVSGDTTTVELNVPDEPASFLNASQHVAQSNIVTMLIDTTK